MSNPFAHEHAIIEPALRSYRDKLLGLPKQVEDKGGDLGPLTELDLFVDGELYKLVHDKFPEDGWISEESPRESGNGRYWIIDPIDGTREIVAGIPEWVVSVGLWENNRPLYGWLYNGPTDTVWHGGPGIGCWANDQDCTVANVDNLQDIVCGVSRTDIKKGRVPETDPAPEPIGSIAYKLGLVAAGTIHATVSVTPKNIWDIAGGIALVLGAGGTVIQFSDGKPMDHIEDIKALQEGGLVACHPDWAEELRKLYGA